MTSSKVFFVLDLGLDEGHDEFFLLVGQDEGLESVVAEFDRGDLVDEHDEPFLVLERVAADVGHGEEELFGGEWPVLELRAGQLVVVRRVDVVGAVAVGKLGLGFVFVVAVDVCDGFGTIALPQWVEADSIVRQEPVVCVTVDDDAAVDRLLDEAASTVGQRYTSVGHVMVAGELLKHLSTCCQTCHEVLLAGMEVEREVLQTSDWLRALEFIVRKILPVDAELLAIPVNTPRLEPIEVHAKLLVRAIAIGLELVDAFLALIGAVDEKARFEDGPEILESDDTIGNKVVLGGDGVLELLVKYPDEKLEMSFGCLICAGGQYLVELVPTVNEGLEGRFEDKTLEVGSDTWIVAEDYAKRLLQEWALYNDGVDLESLATVVTLLVADEESKLGCLIVLCSLYDILRELGHPLKLSIIVFLLVKVLDLGQHANECRVDRFVLLGFFCSTFLGFILAFHLWLSL